MLPGIAFEFIPTCAGLYLAPTKRRMYQDFCPSSVQVIAPFLSADNSRL